MDTTVDVTQLTAVLAWLASGGSAFAVLWLVANVLEKWNKWAGLPKWLKFLLPALTSILVGLGSYYFLQYKDILTVVQPIWQIVVVIVVTYFGSQVGHIMTKTARK